MAREQLRRRDIGDERALRIMQELPRQHFVPEAYRDEAYQDHPVSINHGQTISQPYIVALMTDRLQVRPEHTVLEVGTGSGYQTAILAELAKWVYTVERIGELAQFARDNLEALAINNVSYRVGDGVRGWPEPPVDGPLAGTEPPLQFDRILVAAAAAEVPEELKNQLAQNGRMVIPVGLDMDQRLVLLEKKQGQIQESTICYCRFVRLIGEGQG
jgi:protein-L-isoaspartate(D-aspartate) O-methyltransferase